MTLTCDIAHCYNSITDKDPDDLASFYGSESFMDLFCVIPLMGTLMMRGGYFDDEGTVHTTGLPGEMLVSMVFSDEDDDDGTTKWFNKRERFRDVFLGFTCWDMVTNFGFEKLPDGRVMVYHHGEYFSGSIPPISLIVRLVFGIHARWVAWATEHHINHYAFQNETEFDEQLEEESRADMPFFLLKNYAWSDLMAGLFGRKVAKPSFLIKKSEEAAAAEMDEDEDVEEVEETIEKPIVALENIPLPSEDLPFQRPVIMRRITNDIHMDRRNSKIALRDVEAADEPHLMKRGTVKQRIKMDVALDRHHTMTRKLTQKDENNSLAANSKLARENKGGNAAWEALRSTNNPQAYKAATIAAGERYVQRRATNAAAAVAKGQQGLTFDQKERDEASTPMVQEELALANHVTTMMKKETKKESPTNIVASKQSSEEEIPADKDQVLEKAEHELTLAENKEVVSAPLNLAMQEDVSQAATEAANPDEKEQVMIESSELQKQEDTTTKQVQEDEEEAPIDVKSLSPLAKARLTISSRTTSRPARRASVTNSNGSESAEMK